MDVLDVLADLIKALMIDDMDDTDFKNALGELFVALLGGSGDRNLHEVDKALKLNKDDLTRKLTDLLRKLDEY